MFISNIWETPLSKDEIEKEQNQVTRTQMIKDNFAKERKLARAAKKAKQMASERTGKQTKELLASE